MAELKPYNTTARIKSAATGAVERVPQDKWFATVDVKDFGAIGDGVADDKAAIQAALDTGRDVFLPKGTYALSKTGTGTTKYALVANTNKQKIFGERGAILTLLDSVALDTPVLRVEDCDDVEIFGFEIDGNKQRLDGDPSLGSGEDEGIDFKNCNRAWVRDMYIHDCGQDAIDFDEPGTQLVVDSCFLVDCGGGGVHGAASHITVTNSTILRCGFERYAQGGGFAVEAAAIGSWDGRVIITDNFIIDCPIAIRTCVTVNATKTNYASLITNNHITRTDGTGYADEGIYILDNARNTKVCDNWINGYLIGIYFGYDATSTLQSNSLISDNIIETQPSASAKGIFVSGQNGNQGGISIKNNRISAPSGAGIDVANLRRIVASGNDIYSCLYGLVLTAVTDARVLANTTILVSGNGVRLVGATSNVDIIGNSLPADARSVIFAQDASTWPSSVRITGNYLPGGIQNQQGRTGITIRNNTGFVTEANGTATIASGQTTVDVTHGLSTDVATSSWKPQLSDIAVVPTNNLGNATKYWVSATTNTTFTITVDADPGAGTATFGWQVAKRS